MRQDCVKTIANITTMNATTFLQTIEFLEPELKYTDDCGFPAPRQHLNLMTWPGGMREAA